MLVLGVGGQSNKNSWLTMKHILPQKFNPAQMVNTSVLREIALPEKVGQYIQYTELQRLQLGQTVQVHLKVVLLCAVSLAYTVLPGLVQVNAQG